MDPSNQYRNELGNGAAGGDDQPTHANGTPGEDGRWLRSVVEHSSEMVTIVHPDGALGYANPAWGRALGHDPDEAVGTMNVFDHVHPDDLPHVLEEVGKAFSEGGVATNRAEYRFRHADGSWRWVESVGTYLPDDPTVRGVVVTSRDVTERKEAEERLREAERRLSTLLSNTPAMVYRCRNEPDWPEEYVSDYALELTGHPASAFIQNPTLFGSLISEKDRQRIWDEVQEAVGRGERFRLHYAIHHKDGTLRLVEELGQGVYDESGGVVAVEGLIYDVTDRVGAEERLREAEERYRTLVERIPAVTYVQEATGSKGTTYVSPQMEEMLGYAPEECVSDPHHWIRILHPDDKERVLAEDRRTGETGEPFLMEYRQFARDGRVVWVRDEATLVRDEGGEPSYWLGVQTDVTERKRTEEALRESGERHRRQAIELQLLHEVRTALAQELEPSAVFRTVVETTARIYGYTQVSAYRLQGETLELQHQVGYEQEIARIPIDRGIMGRVVRTGRAVLLEDVRSDPEFLGAIEGITSEICVPLLDEDGIVGVLNVESTGGMKLTEDGLRLIGALAEHVNVALSRSRLHARVRDSEERFRSLIQNSSDVITLLEVDGTVLYQSPSIERMLGYRPEELIGKNAFDYIHPDDLYWARAAFYQMLAEPESRPSAWYRFMHKDGSWRYVESIGSNLLDDPRVGELVINTRDINERKLWQERLREAEERYRNLIETIPAITYVANLDEINTPIYLSPQHEAILGFTAEERVSAPDLWVRRLHPEDRERVLAANNSSNATGEPFDEEYRMVARDGRVVWLHDASVVLRDAEGHPAYRQGVMYDVTERRQTEEALQASEMRLRTVIEQSPLGIHIFAPDGTSLLTNEAWDELWYLDAEEAAQEGNVFEDDQLREAGLVRYIERSAEEGAAVIAPLLLFDPANTGREGCPRWLRTLIYPVKGEDGRVLETVLLLEDFTERKRIEEEIRETNRRLGELATLRADFTAMVAHELDTPLAVIRGYADMLATGELGPAESERALSQIQSETEVLNALVEDVRIAASAERRDFAVVPRKLPVDELLDDAARFVVTLPGEHPLSLQRATDDACWDGVRAGYADPFIFGGTASGPEVWADRYRIGQVLRNLLANAVKYSPEGTPIELRAIPNEAEGRVRIEVVDHGLGIHPDDMERIFEKFGRGRHPEGRKVSGLGLGLYLSRRILQAHGSDLKVNKAPDGGSVFSFDLESER